MFYYSYIISHLVDLTHSLFSPVLDPGTAYDLRLLAD